MRRILVDYARSHNYANRGGGMRPVELDEALAVSNENLALIVEIDTAMDRLATMDARSAEVVQLRFFGGLSVEETAEVLNVSAITFMRGWQFAKAWLIREVMQAGGQ
jgi:RNA polymerase sigma factor (TIGR02999 family)